MHCLVTFMLSDVAVVRNVPLKSAKTRTVPPQIQLKTLNMLESQQNAVLHVALEVQSAVFTALHGMLTGSSDENSVCPSVCLSHACIVTKR